MAYKHGVYVSEVPTSIQASLLTSYTKLKPEAVTSEDIIGGIDATTGEPEGLELVGRVSKRSLSRIFAPTARQELSSTPKP